MKITIHEFDEDNRFFKKHGAKFFPYIRRELSKTEEWLDIPIIFHTTKRYYARYAENETNLFKITTSLPSLKKTVEKLGLTSDSKVYVLNLWDLNRYGDYVYPDSDYALDFLKEY